MSRVTRRNAQWVAEVRFLNRLDTVDEWNKAAREKASEIAAGVCVRERKCVSACACVRERERESVCVCVCTYVFCLRVRERVCVSVGLGVFACVCVLTNGTCVCAYECVRV